MRAFQTNALLADRYQLSMMQAYFENGMMERAVFELFVRRLPVSRNFLVSAGLEQAVEFLESLRFSQEELDWLAKTENFKPSFLEYLKELRFTGDVDAMEEGTPFFSEEPILRISAPLPEAQLVESRLMNLIHYQTLVASKAVRTTLMAPDQILVDFGFRRAHGGEAGLFAARASYIGGFSGTSTLMAGQAFQIPVFGTMAHAFIQAHESEIHAFEDFALSHVGNITFLIDTYDTERGARKVVELAPKLQNEGVHILGVRIDSGDLDAHARQVRAILDEGHLQDVKIFASGNLNEDLIQGLIERGSPIDGFGVGTLMATSSDIPYLDFAYKIQEYAGKPRRKRSEGKATWPGCKQVYRQKGAQGTFIKDCIALVGEPCAGESLIHPVMRNGKRLRPPVPVKEIRNHLLGQLQLLPPELRGLEPARSHYPVVLAPGLVDLARKLDREEHY